jgi:Fic family protein
LAAIQYTEPKDWIRYDFSAVAQHLVDAKATVQALKSVPHRRDWVESLQHMELKREIAGTSRIEGAEFTDRELEEAMKETPEEQLNRSQRQAHAATRAYRQISELPQDRPIDSGLVLDIHWWIVTDADDDHCPPGRLRSRDQNVTFGTPRHRGAEGGRECEQAFENLVRAMGREYRGHDPLIQAMAAHYHLASMHPFLDGNGRTARALEALMLQKAGLRDTCFIAMSNYYHDEKKGYLEALSHTRKLDHDLTPFLVFALDGLKQQVQRVLSELQRNIRRELFRNMMLDLFNRLQSPRRRVVSKRQIEILEALLARGDWMNLKQLQVATSSHYSGLKKPFAAFVRDLDDLIHLDAITYRKTDDDGFEFAARLEWPTEITEKEFFKLIRDLPKAKTHSFLH